MKKLTGIFTAFIISLSLSVGVISDAEAKRFGGGSSFGSRSSYRMPYKRSLSQPKRSASQQQAFQKNQAAKQSLAKRGGLMGMLGGLALGGLLGAMFFGGAFEGLNFMDMIVFGGIAYLLYKLFAARAGAARPAAYNRSGSVYQPEETGSNYSSYDEPKSQTQAGFDTDVLFDKDKKASFNADENFAQDADFDLPAGFDKEAFLNGAKAAFKDLQSAWDRRDLADIRGLTTDKVFAEIQDQLNASQDDNHTDVLKVEAELLEVREVGNELEAVVLFNTILRENTEEQAHQVREVWHFIKAKNSIKPTWFLDGIQQLED